MKKVLYNGLKAFVNRLTDENELFTVSEYVDPVLEITEITDRITKLSGSALLFENNGTDFPLLINTFGSDKRMALALGRNDLDEAGTEIEKLFQSFQSGRELGFFSRIVSLVGMVGYARLMPRKRRGKGTCQQVVMNKPDLSRLPVLKCWPHDGGRFITLPAVHTSHPETGATNVGMYRMQVFDSVTTGMHWHRHKTGANHYEAWKRKGERMPVAVTLGGDPVYTYAATAPLPENIDEYILAGFLRKRRVNLVKCLTQNIWVPDDADIVIEGYVDPSEELKWEGPFGDHTGVYSLADWYPVFHITAITHQRDAVYPTTIVGVPPQEDAWIGKATEKLFLAPIKLTLAPEVKDIHMPPPGVAHNLVIVLIDKKYPGHGNKVISSLYGAGQMMFSKFIIVVSGDCDIRHYDSVLGEIENNCRFMEDLILMKGPLDVLDHSSGSFSYGGKMGIDATKKFPEESGGNELLPFALIEDITLSGSILAKQFPQVIKDFNVLRSGVLAMTITRNRKAAELCKVKEYISSLSYSSGRAIIILLEEGVNISDYNLIAWQITGNSDPLRDIIISDNILIDGGFKLPDRDSFERNWPNVVVSDDATIQAVDKIWPSIFPERFIESPSKQLRELERGDGPEAY